MARHATFDELPRPARILLSNRIKQVTDRFDVEPSLIRSHLLALANGLDPDLVFDHEAFPAALWNFPFTLIDDILESFPRDQAARIIQEEDLPKLACHVNLIEYMADEEVPFYTLDELAEHVKTFAEFLKEHKAFLVTTGLPPRYFRSCRWLYIQLGRLYDTRCTGAPYPHDELFSASKRIPEPQPYSWMKTYGAHVECSYEDAALLPGMAPTDAERIEWNRQRFFDIKLRVLELLYDALSRRSAEHLLKRCIDEMTTALTGEQIEFYCRMDQLYLGTSAIDSVDERPSAKLSPGGLANLFQVIGYVEAELRVGMRSWTKEAMPPAVVQAIRQRAEPLDEDHLHEADDRRWLYFRWIDRPERAALDAALDEMEKRAKGEDAFWQDYQLRVRESLQPQAPVHLLIPLDPRYEKLISPLVQYYADSLMQKCESGENLMPPAPLPTPEGNIFRMRGKSWEIRFGDGQSFPMRDAVGLHYIAHLLTHPGQHSSVEQLDAIRTARMTKGLNFTERGAEHAAMIGSDDGLHVPVGQELVDRQSLREVSDSLAEARKELDVARKNNDASAIGRLETEIDSLYKYLHNATVPGGRSRILSDHKKVRDRVRKAIEESMDKIGEQDDRLELHLQNSITLKDLFCYEPEISVPWNQ